MNRKFGLCMVAATLILVLAVAALPVFAQLILSNQKMKIVQMERHLMRFQGRVHEDGNENVQYVIIDENTRFSTNYRLVSQNEAWRLMKKDMIIRVKGGVNMAGHIKAKSIYW
jgi:hypothetical protein